MHNNGDAQKRKDDEEIIKGKGEIGQRKGYRLRGKQCGLMAGGSRRIVLDYKHHE